MKKLLTVILLLTLALSASAQEELYIYQKGGQTDTIQLSQVSTISHSRLNDLGAQQPDYVVMSVCLTDNSQLQYPLSLLDSVVIQRGDIRTHFTHFIGGTESDVPNNHAPRRTSLDGDYTANSTTVNFFWEEGDHIYLDDGTTNGRRDTEAVLSDTHAVADFSFEDGGSELSAETYTVYYNGQTPRKFNEGSVTSSQTQATANTTTHIGLAGDCGTAVAQRQSDNSYRFNLDHHAAYLCFMPYIGNDLGRTVLKNVTVRCDNLIAGDYTFSTSGMTLKEGADNLSHTITLTTGDFVLPQRATKNTSAYMVLAPQSAASRLTCEFTVYDTELQSTGVYTKILDLDEIEPNAVYVIKANCNNYVVDLGLPVKFLNHNVGAFAPEERGGYYAWGEIEDKGTYSGGSSYELNNLDVGKDIKRTQYDVAYVKYGSVFSMPTVEELCLLVDSCKSWENFTLNGMNGCRITGKNDNHLFLPFAGYRYYTNLSGEKTSGYYRSSQLVPSSEKRSPNLTFSSPTNKKVEKGTGSNDWSLNYVGNCVRPVVSSGIQMTDGTLVQVITDSVAWNIGQTSATLYATVNGLTGAKLKTTEAGFLVGTLADVTAADLSSVTKVSKSINADGSYNCTFTGVTDGIVYYYRAFIKTADDSICYAGVRQFGREYVDLALPSGNLWSNINLGASSPEKDGGFYAWAETATKSNYSNSTHTTYIESTYLQPDGLFDVQATRYDAAAQAWGGTWMTPNYDDLQELIDNCTKAETTLNGMSGYRFTSKNNANSIFIPKSGNHSNTSENYSYQNSYSLSSELLKNNNSNVYFMYINQSTPNSSNREFGYPIRPVYKRHSEAAADHQLFVRTLSARKKYDGTLETDTLRGIIRGLQTGDTAGFRWWKAATETEADGAEVAATPDATGLIKTVINGTIDNLEPGVTYCFQAFVNDGTQKLYGETQKFTAVGVVDLGLSVNWANVNLGAENEGAYGDYYCWGALAPYRNGIRNNQRFSGGTGLTEENGRDIAHEMWHGTYRMPTQTEQEELVNNCTWTWNTTDYKVPGYVVSGTGDYADKSIFLPAAGYFPNSTLSSITSYGYFWSSSAVNNNDAYRLYFHSSSKSVGNEDGSYGKLHGMPVRPVQEKTGRIRTQGSEWAIGASTATLHGSAVMTSSPEMTYGFVIGNNIDVDASEVGATLIQASNRDANGNFSATYTYGSGDEGAPRFFRSYVKIGDTYYQGNIKAITASMLDVEFRSEARAVNGAWSNLPVNRYTSSNPALSSSYDATYHRYFNDFTANTYASTGKLHYPCYFADKADFKSKLEDGHSLEVLFKVQDVPTSTGRADVFSSDQSGGSGIGLYNKHICASFWLGGNFYRVETEITPALNTYYHVVTVWDQTEGQIMVYVNGSLAKTEVNTKFKNAFREPDTDSQYYVVGGNPYGSGVQESFNGYVALARVYDEVLTTSQVEQLFNGLTK